MIIDSNKELIIDREYKVAVVCLTYNQSNFIIDALNGFSVQKTNFPFVCIVMDDASTDGEPDVIHNWLCNECKIDEAQYYDLDLANVIVAPHCSNANCTMAVYFMKKNLFHNIDLKFSLLVDWFRHSEYFAECEGDDYWIDCAKLQRQADCLDKHLEVDCCVHRNYTKNNDTLFSNVYLDDESIITLEDNILRLNFVPAAGSIFLRNSVLLSLPHWFSLFPVDYSLIICGALRGGVYYLPQVMSVYRNNVCDSICDRIRNNTDYRRAYYNRAIKMLNALDEDLNFEHHKVIQASILIASMNCTNSLFSNIMNIIRYRKGFCLIPHYHQVRLILGCVIPKGVGGCAFVKKLRKTV